MPWVITKLCIDCKDAECAEVCPVDCIYELQVDDEAVSRRVRDRLGEPPPGLVQLGADLRDIRLFASGPCVDSLADGRGFRAARRDLLLRGSELRQ